MAQLFNFDDFYKEMTAKTEIPLNYSGVDLDQATEQAEYVTDNVLYYVSHIYADGRVYDGDYRIMIRVTDDGNTTDYFARQWHPIDDIVASGAASDWEPRKAREGVIELDAYDASSGIKYYLLNDCNGPTTTTQVNTVKFSIFPKYEAITGDPAQYIGDRFPADFSGTDQQWKTTVNQNVVGKDYRWSGGGYAPGSGLSIFMRCMYGILGLMGDDRTKSMKWMFGTKYGMWRTGKGSNAVISQDRFKKWVKRLTDTCAENGIGVKVDMYDNEYAREVTSEDATKEDYKRNRLAARMKHKIYEAEVKISDWTRTDMGKRTTFDDAYNVELPKFIDRFGNGSAGDADYVPLMAYKDGETQSAVIPSLRDAFKGWYYPASELEDSFNDNIQTILDTMSQATLGWKCISSKYKSAVTEIAGKYKSYPTTVTSGGTTTSAYNYVAFDLTYVLNAMCLRGYGNYATFYNYGVYPKVTLRGGYTLTNTTTLTALGFSSATTVVDEYTIGKYNSRDKSFTGTYEVAHIPTINMLKKMSLYSSNDSRYTNASSITDCYTSNGRKYGSSDYTTENAPADITRTRSVTSSMSGSDVAKTLTAYFNAAIHNNGIITSNDDIATFNVTEADYKLTSNNLDIDTSDLVDSKGVALTDTKSNILRAYRYYMYYIACYMNLIAINGHKKSYMDSLINAIKGKGGFPAYLSAGRSAKTLTPQPLFGTKIDSSGAKIGTISYDVLHWTESSTVDGDDITIVAMATPAYEEVWNAPSDGPDNVGPLCDAVDVLYDAYVAMRSNLPTAFMRYGVEPVTDTLELLSGISDDFAELRETVYRIRIYQMFAQESVFGNKSLVGTSGLSTKYDNVFGKGTTDTFFDYAQYAPMWNMPARLMFPVSMYKKVRKKYKRWGRTRHRTVKIPIGVRWCEVQFIDTNVYQAYPQANTTPGKDVSIGANVSISKQGDAYLYKFSSDLSEDVLNASTVTLYSGVEGTGEENGEYRGLTVVDNRTLTGENGPLASSLYVIKLRVPLAPSQTDDTKYAVTVNYRMPHLPYDSELKEKAFIGYGPLSQDKRFSAVTNGAGGFGIRGEERHDGWTVFHPSSGSLRDLRSGTTTYDVVDTSTGKHSHTEMCQSINVGDKVAVLMRMLSDEFGSSRVQLVETYRSAEDQASICLGSEESSFLSWHNYGLAVKIVVYEEDLSTPADLYGDVYEQMLPIACAFAEACGKGMIGEPCNVVWCRQLKVSPSLFDWEFLPIGVGHKDVIKFRQDTLNQMDPVLERSYVNVDAAGIVKNWSKPDSTYAKPYILSGSSAYRNSTIVNGQHYVSPGKIRNFNHVSDIVLYDAREYIDLIQLKMNAHGTGLMPGMDMLTWRTGNSTSCNQLIRYYAMTGNIKGSKSLLAGNYYDTYNYINSMYYSTDPVRYVKEMLGDRYYDVRITVDKDGDSSYITLSDGLLHIRAEDAYPDMPSSSSDRFKSKQATPDRMKRGNWYDGKFYTYDERPIEEKVSDAPVIDGYTLASGKYTATGSDALVLHSVVATQIRKEYDAICDMFNNYNGQLMYDRFEDGPMYKMADMLENEYGLVEAQDLFTCEELMDALLKDEINSKVDNGGVDGGIDPGDGGLTGNGGTVGGGSVYEKVVNNAQVAGMKRALLTKEHIHINDMHSGVSMEELYKRLTVKGYSANDLLK